MTSLKFWKKKNKSIDYVWHLDETYIKVKGDWCYLYLVIDGDGYTLDIKLRKTCDHKVAFMFKKRLAKVFWEPVFTTDQAPALLCAFKNLKSKDFYVHMKHCTVKHSNNLSEQDHRHFSKSAGFQTLRHASRTIKGTETIPAI